MPNVKQGGGYSLTFSKKNRDVKIQLDTLKNNGIVITDYICEAIRFFEKNKDNSFNETQIEDNSFNKKQIKDEDIERIVEEKVRHLFAKYNKSIASQTEPPSLEDNLEYINEEDLEED